MEPLVTLQFLHQWFPASQYSNTSANESDLVLAPDADDLVLWFRKDKLHISRSQNPNEKEKAAAAGFEKYTNKPYSPTIKD